MKRPQEPAGKVAIYGAGVAGLAAAVALTRAGFEVAIFERSARPPERGMGFLLMGNGLAALRGLGFNSVCDLGITATAAVICDPQGKAIRRSDFTPHLGISRMALLQLLTEALPAGCVQQGRAFRAFEPGPNETHLGVLDDGQRIAADLHIGADGLHSAVRRQLAPEHAPRLSGVNELISRLVAPDLVQSFGSTLLRFRSPGDGLGVGIVPTSADSLIWYLTHDTSRWDFPDTIEGRCALAAQVAEWAWPVPLLVGRTDFAHSYFWRTADMDAPVATCWDDVVLVGDAAHPLLPFSTQGVNAALVDAVTLTSVITKKGISAETLRQWQRSRSSTAIFLRYGRERHRGFMNSERTWVPDPPFPEEEMQREIRAIEEEARA